MLLSAELLCAELLCAAVVQRDCKTISDNVFDFLIKRSYQKKLSEYALSEIAVSDRRSGFFGFIRNGYF